MRNASTRRVSVADGGGNTDGWSGNPVLALDGDTVAFDSVATNVVPGPDANGKGSDVYVFRARIGDVLRVSVATNGAQASLGVSYGPALSADGRFVAFTSRAQLGCGIPHGNERRRRVTTQPSDVYVRDLEGLATQCVSRGAASSYHASIDRTGRMVAFVSEATNTTDDPKHHEPNVYLRDLTRDAIRLVSRNARGRPGNAASLHPAISGDGRFIAFESLASDLLCARRCRDGTLDHNLVPDVYMFDVAANATTRLSTGCESEVWWEASRGPALSADGAPIAISSRHPISRDDLSDDDDLYVFRSHLLAQPTDTGHLAVHRK
jgi:Tol biopolymer transport system component